MYNKTLCSEDDEGEYREEQDGLCCIFSTGLSVRALLGE